MLQEFETKILDINVAEIEEKLQKIWATFTEDTTLMKRRVFDIQPHTKESKWKRIRLRQKGEKATLTYKDWWWNEIWGTKELEVKIWDFETMTKILQKLEWKGTAYQENKRKVYMLDDIEFCIDTWPKINPYLEIEAPNLEKVHKWLELLWLTDKDVWDMWLMEIFAKFYNLNLHDYPVLKFDS